jgi:hypothetical protein
MAQAGFTPIQLYRTTTASAVPVNTNLADGELAINTLDEKLYFKNSAGTVKLLAANVTPAANGGTGLTSSGADGNVLTSNGTTWTSAALPAGGLTYIFTTTPVTATDKQGVLTSTAGGSFTVTLPATPATGAQVVVADAGASWGTNNLTVGRNGSNINGLAEDLICDITGASVQFVYDGTSWEVYAQVGGNGGTAVTLDGVQTLTNKTITFADNTLTGVAGTTATQTLTNKTLTAPESTGAIYDNGSVRGNVVAVAALDIDCSAGNYFTKTINGASTFTFSNAPSSRSYAFTLELTVTSGAATWPAAVQWPGGTAPTLGTSKTSLLMFVTDDGGTRWRGASLIDYTT